MGPAYVLMSFNTCSEAILCNLLVDFGSTPTAVSVATICECHAQEAQKVELEQPEASPEKQAESESAAQSPEVSAAHENKDAVDEHAASSVPAHAISDTEDDAATDTPTSTSSWHGTPTWNDMTTFSQVRPCTKCFCRAPSSSIQMRPGIHDDIHDESIQ